MQRFHTIILAGSRRSAWLFAIALFARIAWWLWAGIDLNDAPDFNRYNEFSNNILRGNFNMQAGLFIVAPLFPFFLAIAKLVLGAHWLQGLALIQIIIASASTIYLAKSAELIFGSKRIGVIAGTIYALYPPLLYYTQLPSQESLFQSTFVIFFYFLCKYCTSPTSKASLKLSIFYSLSLLIKSHIIIMAPFIASILYLKNRWKRSAIKNCFIFLVTVGIAMAPWGIYNYYFNHQYIVSSSGLGGHFLTGHNDDFYKYTINTPPRESREFARLKSMQFKVFAQASEIISNDNHEGRRQKIYLNLGLDWAKENPDKSIKLLIFNMWNHLKPGYSLKFHDFRPWLVSLIFSTPIYAMAYVELLKSARAPEKHLPLPALSLFATMLIFATVFYSQNRFRLVTIEPLYIIYSSPLLLKIFTLCRAKAIPGDLIK